MQNSKLRVGIIGLGMVGDPIRRWFQEIKGYARGRELFCFDIDVKKGFQDDINKADVIFIAVPTPSPKGGGADLSILHAAIKTVADGKIIVIKSTVPPGTSEALQKKYPKKKFIFSPEFLTESQVWLDFSRPDRQIFGPTEHARDSVKEVQMLLPMAPFSRPWSSDYTKKEVTATEAELAKYASNVFGYIKVIYGNILADMCTALGINYESVREIMSADPRIGPAWLDVSHGNYCGAGGFCFPKDMNALIEFAEKEIPVKYRDGVVVLKAVRDYNRKLLKKQNLSEEIVSKHDREIKVSSRKPARSPKES